MGNKSVRIPKADLDELLLKTSFTERQIKDWYRGFMVSFS